MFSFFFFRLFCFEWINYPKKEKTQFSFLADCPLLFNHFLRKLPKVEISYTRKSKKKNLKKKKYSKMSKIVESLSSLSLAMHMNFSFNTTLQLRKYCWCLEIDWLFTFKWCVFYSVVSEKYVVDFVRVVLS